MKEKLFILLLVTTMNTRAQINCSPSVTNGLVAFYPFCGNANDGSGNGHNGTVNGPVLTTDRSGNANSAYLFDGVDDNINVGNYSAIISSGNNFSMSVWIQANLVKPQVILMLDPDNFNDRINAAVYYDHNGVSSTFWDYGDCTNGGRSYNIGTTFSPAWEHYVFIVNSTQNYMEVYKNGALQVQVNHSSSLINRNRDLKIGGAIATGNAPFFFSGKIDDMAIYNRVLTAAEIQQLYNPCAGITASITAYGNTTFCNGSNVLLVANSGYTGYQWQKNGVNIGGATNKTYTATVAATFRCITTCGTSTATSNSIVTTKLSNAIVTITAAGSTTFCAGSSVALNAANPGAGYTYQWYRSNISINGASGLSYTAYNPGTYKLVTTNTANGCSYMTNSFTTTVNCRMMDPEAFSGSIEPINTGNKLIVYPNPTSNSFTVELNDEIGTDGSATIRVFTISGQMVYEAIEQMTNGLLEKRIDFNGEEIKNGLYILKIITGNQVYESKVMIN